MVARALRWLVAALPIVASFALTFWLSRTLPPQRLGVPVWVWLIGAIAVATIVLFGVERSARRVLPLAALFRLSLVFPDKAPSRFRLAIRSQTTRTLERDIERARAAGEHGDVTEAAELVLVLVAALNRHDRLTRGHSERVRAYSRMLGEELGLSGEDLDRLNWAALLHDIGKLRVPYEILNSDTRPTEEQWQILKRHAEWGEELTQPLRDWLGDAWHAIGQHHERWDGDGYPRGLGTTDISLYGRIVAVADTYDVITSTRSYKQPMAPDQARQELARCAGTQFDPVIVRAFLNLGIARIRPAMSPLAWLASLGGLIGTTSAPAIGSLAATLVTATAVTAGTLSVTPPAEPPAPIEIIDESGELALDVPLDPPGAAPGDAGALGDDAGSGGPTLTGTDESEAADANTPPGGASNDGVPGDGGDVAVAEPTPTPPPVQGPGNTTGSSPGTDPTPSPTATPTPTSTPVPTPTPTATP
ncbi:MAG: HD domain-containing protein, partial [Acidimicrobiales bacterium]|nr:HD domain-containing protein [Acidimicrobiales bacterium]